MLVDWLLSPWKQHNPRPFHGWFERKPYFQIFLGRTLGNPAGWIYPLHFPYSSSSPLSSGLAGKHTRFWSRSWPRWNKEQTDLNEWIGNLNIYYTTVYIDSVWGVLWKKFALEIIWIHTFTYLQLFKTNIFFRFPVKRLIKPVSIY